jgi:hypothetical protein
MLALSSASLVLWEDTLGIMLRGLADAGDVESSRESLPKACVLVTESCVVAFETSCGRAGVTECDDEGRDVKAGTPSCGRGGSGGGVLSLEGEDMPLYEGLREALPIMPSVGLAKSCCSTRSAFFGASSTACVVGSFGASLVDGWL